MSDMDVSLRLHLVNDLSKEAKRAEADLKKLDQAVKGLGKGGRGQLDKGLNDLSRKARDSAASIKQLGDGVRNLNGVKTNTVEAEIKAVGTASSGVIDNIKAVQTAINRLDATNTNTAEAEIKSIGTASTGVIDNIKAVQTAIDRLDAINTNTAEAEIREIGKAAREAKIDLDQLQRENANTIGRQNVSSTDRPVNRESSMNLTNAASGFWLATQVEEAVKWINNIGDPLRHLENEVASVAITAGRRDPETVAKLMASNSDLAKKYGVQRSTVNEARNAFVGAGVGIDSQEQILDPTLKAAKASKSDPTNVADAAIAVKQNLGVKDSEIPSFFDQMAKGVDLGRFEVDAMAKNLPKLAAAYEKTGRKGLDATSELIAFAQVARRTAGSSDDAATNMQNFFGKLFADDSVKNFKDQGIDLNKIHKNSVANNTPYFLDVIDKMIEVANGDPMKASALFPDQQARSAADAMSANRKLYTDWQNQIRNQSAGAVDAAWNFKKEQPEERKARRDQVFQQKYENTGGFVGSLYEGIIDLAAKAIDGTFYDQRRKENLPVELEENKTRREALQLQLQELEARKASRGDPVGEIQAKINAVNRALKFVDGDAASKRDELRRLNPEGEIPRKAIDDAKDLGKSTGKIPIPERRPLDIRGDVPIPSARPIEQSLGKDMSGAADQAMDGYNGNLKSALDQAISMTSNAVSQMKALLNFTASPTISPNIVTPTGQQTTKAVPGKQSSLQQSNSTVKLTQHITPQNSKVAAMRAVKEQNRAVRMAQARALSDLGAKTA